MEKRTLQQNKSIHKLFETLANDLNEKGLEMKIILKPSYQIWWNKDSVKEHLFKPLMKAMYKKESTTELTTAEVSKVYEQLAKILGEKYGVEMEFPSNEALIEYDNG